MPPIETLKTALRQHPPLLEFLTSLSQRPAVVLKGVPGSLKAFLAALLVESGRRVICASPRQTSHDEWLADLSQLLPDERVGLLLSGLAQEDVSPFESRIFRARALQGWISALPFALIVDPDSLWRGVLPRPEALEKIRIKLTPGLTLGRDYLARRLVEARYVRTDLVENRGEFAVRGSILDLFPFTHDNPLRLEFWADRLESLRSFTPTTQRTIEPLNQDTIFLADVASETGANLLDYHQSTDVLLVEDSEGLDLQAQKTEFGKTWKELQQRCTTVYWGGVRFETPKINLEGIPQEDFGGQIDRLAQTLSESATRGAPNFIACDNQGQLERLSELLEDRDLDPLPQFLVAHFSGGFHLPAPAPSLYTDHQIFRRPRRRRTYFRLHNFSPIERTESLKKGDFVVHEDYGIGRFLGLATIEVGGRQRECLQIEYRNRVMLYVRLESLRKVQKFSGRDGFEPPLTRIGRGEWEKIRKKAQAGVKVLAEDLRGLYARRAAQDGFSFPDDSAAQLELEACFEYEETPDQLQAIEEVKRDMEEPRPMDRLVCGDVGYGKTEVALRAAYKAILGGKQAALLVPTTLLAQQHYTTFTHRLTELAVQVEMLSRFRSLKEQQEILKQLREGRIDIVIGTHRLLSLDVVFNNLGLLIIDEEHRFGVKHKERLKQLRMQVDVLVLTATPIPRTLHMALIGARDMSVIKTPPQHRLPIETEIATFSRELICEAIFREVDRGGQVYFVHNRIETIQGVKKMLERWLPEIRFVVGHGQMPEKQLEKTMTDFWAHKYDVLISTMIIESGLDLPNVNTMIVNRADRFGLAQLYQLRGRIGRSTRQAYAYLLIPPRLVLSDPARKRLEAIRDCSYLGAGFQIAMHDLEIRGAGEIFGARQSGFMQAVGFDLYQKMLEEAVQDLHEDSQISTRLAGNSWPDYEPKIEFPFDAYLPTEYVELPEQRVELYRRLSSAQITSALDHIVEEISDRYGTPPEKAQHLFDLIELKIGCWRGGLSRLELKDEYLLADVLSLENQPWASRLEEMIRKLDGFPVEFSGTEPPQIILRWDRGTGWKEKIVQGKELLRRLSVNNKENHREAGSN